MSILEIASPYRLTVEPRQPLVERSTQPRSRNGRLRCAFHAQAEIEVRRSKVVQRVVDLIHTIGLGFLPGRVAYGDGLQVEESLAVPAYQEIGMRRDPGNIGMKFHLETAAEQKVVEEQLKDGGPVLPFDRRPESLLKVPTLVFGQFQEPRFEESADRRDPWPLAVPVVRVHRLPIALRSLSSWCRGRLE
jgi:hypothetical protein